MSRIAITGAGGFIGTALARRYLEVGHEVIALTRRPTAHGEWISWQIGDPLPPQCATVDTVIHLASAALVARDNMNDAVDKDISGTRRLTMSIRSLCAAGSSIRFVFLSSQSAHVQAKNAYGRSKLAIENELGRSNEVIVRPGLVYDDAGGSVFGLFEKLSRLPAVPVISSGANIQPIHVTELVECLVKITEMAVCEKLYCVGAVVPITFAQAIKATAHRFGRPGPWTIPVPLAPVKAAAWLVDKLMHVTPSIGERIDGLVALQPMETATSLKLLDISVENFDTKK